MVKDKNQLLEGSHVADSLSFEDISQGQLGDCYFLSVLSCIVKEHPQVVQELFRNNQMNTNGMYYLTICKNGIVKHIFIDDYVPTKYD
mmetsp:Transcript_25071/g.17736  ORF Transcript_25071/g.17736 Transcript_25071/m.17736 type:complete len:88 (-) Transcript_25071:1656-1919(-)